MDSVQRPLAGNPDANNQGKEMAYDYDVDEAQAQLHHQQLINDERASMDRRRSHTRQHLLNQVAQNGNLIHENVALEKKAKALEERVALLEAQLESVSSLARMKLVNSAALLKTIRHLRDAWTNDQPDSSVRKAVDGSLDGFYEENIQKCKLDRDLMIDINGQIQASIANAKPARR
ncbi:hypothetical protein [Xanthomonas axonopodis]